MKATVALVLTLLLNHAAFAGFWGDGSFENDDALDWATECVTSNSLEPVVAALDTALSLDFIKTPEGAVAVAAAEVVAAGLGKPSRSLPSELEAWVRRQPPEQLALLAPRARKALSRVTDPRVSALRQAWSTGRPNKWMRVIADLDSRLAN